MPRPALQTFVRGLVRRTGFDVVRWQAGLGREPYQDMKRLVTRASPMLFDVGGNEGQTVRQYRTTFPDGRIHAFEPGPAPFQRLAAQWGRDPQVSIWNVAVGAEAGTLTLNENSSSVMNSVLPLGRQGWGKVVSSREAPVIRLDDFAAEHGVDYVDVLKSDTQGYDLKVLEGAERLLANGKIGLVFVELIASNMYEGLPAFDKVIGHMLERDYRIISFYEQFYQGNILGWTDALFAHSSLVA